MKWRSETGAERPGRKGIDVFPCETQVEVDIVVLFAKTPECPSTYLRQIRDDINKDFLVILWIKMTMRLCINISYYTPMPRDMTDVISLRYLK